VDRDPCSGNVTQGLRGEMTCRMQEVLVLGMFFRCSCSAGAEKTLVQPRFDILLPSNSKHSSWGGGSEHNKNTRKMRWCI
jgi:hypothetical protein